MKNAIKFGFGVALGVHLFNMCHAAVNFAVDKYISKKFDEDGNFREHVKVMSPELYVKLRKEDKE